MKNILFSQLIILRIFLLLIMTPIFMIIRVITSEDFDELNFNKIQDLIDKVNE